MQDTEIENRHEDLCERSEGRREDRSLLFDAPRHAYIAQRRSYHALQKMADLCEWILTKYFKEQSSFVNLC